MKGCRENKSLIKRRVEVRGRPWGRLKRFISQARGRASAVTQQLLCLPDGVGPEEDLGASPI